MSLIERADEMADFAVYCRGVEADTVGTLNRAVWRERAEWADACAADFRGAVDLLRDAHDRDRLDGSMPSIDWYKQVDAYLNPSATRWQ